MHTSNSTRFRFVLLFLSVSVVFVVYIVTRRTAASDSSTQDVGTSIQSGQTSEHSTAERIALLQQKVAALKSDVTMLRDEKEMAPPRGAAATHRQDDTSVSAQLNEAEMQAQRKLEEDRIFSQINQSFSAQPIDHSWSVLMTGRLNEHIRTRQMENSDVKNIECRSSACKIEINIHDGADLAAIRDNFRFLMADVMGSGASKQDETGRFIIYLAKDPQAIGIAAQP